MKTYSISRYLTASLIITVTLVSTLSIIAIYFEAALNAKKDLENKADEIMGDLVRMFEFPLWMVSDKTVQMTGSAIAQNEVVSRLIVKNHKGEIVFVLDKERDHDTVNRYEKIYHNENFIGDVELGLTRRLYKREQQKRLIRYLFVALFIILTIGGVSGFFVRAFLKKPLASLNNIVGAYAKGQYDSKADELPYEEFALFGTVLNQMGQAINEQQTHLEQLVEERTAELEAQAVELKKSKEAAEAANQSKSVFLARMSHEIRTPLNAVTGLTNIVLKSDLTTGQRDYLNKVQIASKNLLEVINDILDFSKIEAGRLELMHTPFDLGLVMDELTDMFSNRVTQKDIELVFTTSPDVPRQLIGDASRLNQVLINLIENAVKFTETGEIVVKLERDEQRDQQTGQTTIKFQVRDTGIGIAADVLPTLFDPFIQAEGYLTRKHEGAGLGLAICRRLVELMGGCISAESTPSRGSTFSFTIMMETQKEEKPHLHLPTDLNGLKILVVDDSASARQVLVDQLESFTFNVTAVDSGDKAIAAFQQTAHEKPFKVVLMDWKMPGMDGIETAMAIRNDTSPHRPPIIILVTAYGRALLQKNKETAAACTMLLKPVKTSELFNTIVELLEKKEVVVLPRKKKPAVQLARRLYGRRVLVVEDSALNRDVAVALLEETGLVVEIAVNGQIAVDKRAGSPEGYYGAVLMDIQMPVMDGYEATRRIREWERQQTESRIPIIALTAHALKGEQEKCLAADMDDYLSKPLDENELHRVLLKWILPAHVEEDASHR